MRWRGDSVDPAVRWKDPYTLLSICIGAYFAVRFSQVIIGSVVPLVIEEFAVSRGTVGAVLTGMWVAYALLQLPSGVLADRFGEGSVVLAALGITAVATLGLAAAPTVPILAAAAIGLGIGAGAYYNPATALLTREFDGIGGAIGAHRIGGQVAGVLAPLVAAAAGVRYGWRAAIALGSLLAVVIAGVFLREHASTAPVRSDASLRELFDPGALLGLLIRPHTRNTTFMMTLVEFVGLAAMAFLPAFLVEHYGFSIGRANLLFATFFAVSALSQPLGGRLSDRIGRDATATMQASAGVVGYGALALGSTTLVAVPALVLAGVAMSTTPVLQSRMMDGLVDTNRGKGFGLFRTLYLLVSATGTAVVGVTADVGGWGVAFGLLAALLGAVLLSLIVIGIAGRTE
jgi:MFS family permease